MSGFDADARLRRALAAHAKAADAAITITRSATTRWASATFVGARHEVELTAIATDAVECWLSDLPDAELAMAGHLVADLKVVAVSQAEDRLTLTLEALTVEEN